MKSFLLLFLLFVCGIAHATNYYFSLSTGDDTRTAAQAQNQATPWKSISKLNAYFSSLTAGDSVLFKRGEVFYGSILIGKSGASGRPINIGAYGTGSNPIITGLLDITSWVNVGTNLWESSAAVSTLSTLKMVVINGVNTPMGRYPNISSTLTYPPKHLVPGNNGWLNYESYSGSNQITDNQLPASPNWTGAEAVVKKGNWVVDHGIISNHSGTTITYTPAMPNDDGLNDMSYFIQNDIRTLDEQNEWYYNPSTKKLTIYSTTMPNKLQVANFQNLITRNDKDYISISNLDIKGSNDDMIFLKGNSAGNTAGWIISNCNLSCAGRDGIYCHDSGTGVTISNNTLTDCNNNGVYFGVYSSNIVINSNVLKNIGINAGMTDQDINKGNTSCTGISANCDYAPYNLTVRYNKLSNIGYNGIGFGGTNVLVSNNFIENFLAVKTDGGAIYTWNSDGARSNSNRVVEDNIIINGSDLGVIGSQLEEQELSVNGIYLDGGSDHVTIRRNSISHVNAAGIYMNTPLDCIVRDNTVYDCRYASIHANKANGASDLNLVVKNNVCVARSLNTAPTNSNQRCFYYLSWADDITSNLTSDSNYFARPIDDATANPISRVVFSGTYLSWGEPDVQTKYTLAAWKNAFPEFDQNSKKSPVTVTTTNDLRFEYNETAAAKTVTLGANYMDVRSVSYPGTITLAPYTSAVLIKTGTGNILPTANAGPDQTIALPTVLINLSGSGSDPDGTISSYQWTKVSGPTSGLITILTSAITTVTALVQGIYKFELKVTDNSGAVARDTMQVTVNGLLNTAPTTNAGPDQIITLPTNTVSLSATAADADGTISAYLWTKISGPTSGTIASSTTAVTTATSLTQGIYKFEIKVTDNSGAVARDTMQVTVNAAVNIVPVANAGVDQTITFPTSSVTLSGSGTDTDGTITAYLWTKVSGPTSGTITSATTAGTTVTGLTQGIYKFELKVTDNSGGTAKDTMQVTVNAAANIAPVANAGVDKTISLPTNAVSLTGSGTDTDGTITAYLWTKISGPTNGTITSSSSASTTVTSLVQGVYKFELKVTDNSGATGRDTMQVTVNAAGNISPVANAGVDKTISLPTNSVSLTGSGTDTDGTITAYSWTKISGPTNGSITNATSANATASSLVQGVYKFELKVTDNSGAFGRDTMQVTVNAAGNIAPTANAGVDKTITLPTNAVSLSGSGTDPGGTITAYLWTKISGPANGTITGFTSANATVTGLVQAVYKFELKVTDNNGAVGRDTMQVTVNVANQLPVANAGVDRSLTLPNYTVALSGSGTDPDGTITAYLWTKISGPTSGTIITPTAAATAAMGLTQGIYLYELKVTDNSGATDTDTMQVTVNPAPNQLPTANAGVDQTITLPTNTVSLSGRGTDTDGTITAYLWAKVSGPTSYTITNPTAAATSITGLVQGTYQFELKVTDNSGAVARDTMQVTVKSVFIPATNAYGGVAWPIPGTIQAEDFDNGGQNVAYYDDGVANLGGVYRPTESVDIENSTDGTPDVGWVVPGEWMKYSVNVTSTGTYKIEARVASASSGRTFNIEMDGTVIATVTVPNTGATQTWATVTIPNISLTAGYRTMRIYALSGNSYNINYIKFTATGSGKTSTSKGDAEQEPVIEEETFTNTTTVSAFPNPFAGSVKVRLNGKPAGVYQLSLIDVFGKTVWKKIINKSSGSVIETINANDLPGGVYIVEILSPDKKRITTTIIKQH